jgi:hypothetical protein
MFENSAGKDVVDQLKFMADNGFTALEDNGMMGRPGGRAGTNCQRNDPAGHEDGRIRGGLRQLAAANHA